MWQHTARHFARRLTAVPLIRNSLRGLSRKGLLPSAFWRRLPVDGIFSVPLPSRRPLLYSGTPNDVISRALFWRDFYEWESDTIPVFFHLAREATRIVDVGANTGLYTLLACAANPAAQVVAFEPVPRVYDKLEENVRLNGVARRCELHREAVSHEVGVAKFHVPFGELPTSASLNTQGFRGYKGNVIEVATTTVDTTLGNKQAELVKIDVEGFEDRVLQGMQRVLASCAPTLVIECLPDGPYRRVEEILLQFDYSFYHLCGRGPTPVTRLIPDARRSNQNFLCVSRKHGAKLGRW